MQPNKAKLSFLIMALGVAFEHFDMMLVSLLTSSLVEEFVGASNPDLKMLFAYIGYAIAFLFRPLGAFCFGCIGDLYGRKTSLVSSMCLMSAATLALAFLPGVQVIGITSTLLFLLCRIAQGLAVGGEYGTAMTYAYELNPKYRTFFGACVISSTHVGGVFASFLASLYVDHVRVTFLIGGLVGFFLLLFRSLMKEYHVVTAKKVSEIAVKSVKDKKSILSALLVASTMALVFYGSLIYLNERVHQDLQISRAEIFKANTFLLGLWIVLPPCFGYVADKLNISLRKMMRFGAMGVFFSAPLLGIALASSSYTAVVTTQILTHLFLMIFALCTPRFFGDLFAGEARNTTISTTYSLGASFTSALAPAICHGSIALFNTNFAICVPFMLVALAASLILKKEDVCDRMTLLNSTTSR